MPKKIISTSIDEALYEGLEKLTRQRLAAALNQADSKLDTRSASRSALVQEAIIGYLAAHDIICGVGVDVDTLKNGKRILLLPLTSQDIAQLSRAAECAENPGSAVSLRQTALDVLRGALALREEEARNV